MTFDEQIATFLGRTPQLAPSVFIAPSAFVVGDVTIGEEASIWPACSLRGDIAPIRIGAHSNIQDGSVLHVTHDGPYTPGGFPLTIGSDVTVGHGAILHACTIADACLIGMHATVLDGVRVCRHSMIGAGAMVSPGKVVGEGELWLGNPARCVRKLTDTQIEQLHYSAKHYVRLKNDYVNVAQSITAR